jgi:hypothetical protein
MKSGDLVRVIKKVATPYMPEGTVGFVMHDGPRVFSGSLEMLFVVANGKRFTEYKDNLELLNAPD